ncbi:MAG: hypothetical protein IJ200_03555 [Prevotella sp.]|nr:hypothetical protein [Prevotella sp.]
MLAMICLIPLCVTAQEEHFKLLGQWSIEGEEFGLTPYCFEITMDRYGNMYAKVPASYSISRKVVTGWQNTSVYVFKDGSGYSFDPINSRQQSCYGVNFKRATGSNEYKAIRILVGNHIEDEKLSAFVSYIYGPMEDKIYRMGETNFIKVGDVEKPQLVDNKQTRKKGDEGKVAEAVDLGLSIKWASWNVGASKPEEYGGYYAWGETEEKDIYNWSNYKYINKTIEGDYWDEKSNKIVYKYQRIGTRLYDEDVISGKNRFAVVSICGTSYDVAYTKWGSKWRMPTLEEITELENKCSKEHSKLNGVEGWYFTGPNGNKIFLPSAGYKDESSVSYDMKDWRGAACMYWSGDLITYLNYLGDQDGSEAFSISFDNKGVPFGNYFSRCTGLTVRPVTK